VRKEKGAKFFGVIETKPLWAEGYLATGESPGNDERLHPISKEKGKKGLFVGSKKSNSPWVFIDQEKKKGRRLEVLPPISLSFNH